MCNYLISIVGPTAIGKTALSIAIANHFESPIISSDSRQFYKEMTLGTAVPSDRELAQAPHHFIQNRSIFEDYNVGQFEKDAVKKLNELFEEHTIIVMVGGSGLYVDAVLKGLDNFPEVDSSIRLTLKDQLENEGIESLQQQLKELDIATFHKIDIDNHQRVIRALEICIGTGKKFSSFLTDKASKRNFIPIKIGVTAEREIIYDRINQRVDVMIKEGLLEEAKKLHMHKNLNALQTVGYKELFQHLDGNYELDFAISEIKKNTRRFAKRQGTWFRKDADIKWFDFKQERNIIIEYIQTLINS
jgi:tRNA dimethylallyltransferase